MKKILLIPALSLAFVFSLAFASPKNEMMELNGPVPVRNGQPMIMPPPPEPEPVYAVTQQTEDPNETIKNIASQLPKISGDRYIVRFEVLPFHPKDAPESAPDKIQANK
ncbi:hypothetical protein [Pantoea vagans]|uniref:hypothetical protein n=1 Tax=Pantoea vagans TaxID=470934 RepID=UPI0032094BB2